MKLNKISKLNKLLNISKNILKVLFFLVFTTSCGINILSDFGDKTSDEAVLYDIKKLNNGGSYTEALAKFADLSAAKLAERDTQFLLSKVYSGLCGFSFFDYVTVLSEATSSPKTFLKLLMDSAPSSTTTHIDNCILAETTITTYAASATDRTEEENLLLFLLEMLKIGKILNTHFDTNNDQVTDVVDACSGVVLPNSGSTLYAQHVVTGLAIMSLSAAGLTSSELSGVTGALTPACAAAVTAGFPICNTTDASSVSNDQENLIRSFIKEDSFLGLGVNCTGDILACFCP